MSAGPVNTTHAILDCFDCLLPAAGPQPDPARGADFGDSDKPAFHEVLRDSSSDRSAVADQGAEDTDVRPLNESDRAGQSSSDQADAENQTEDGKPVDAEASDDQAEAEGKSQDTEGAEEETGNQQQAETDEAGAEAEAAAAAAATAAAELALVQAATTGQSAVAAETTGGQQAENTQANASKSTTAQLAQAQSAAAPVQSNAQVQGQAQANGPAVDVAATAVSTVAIQTGDQAQANVGDTGAESKTTAQAAATNTTTQSSNTQASTAFTLPDQPTAEAKLPINPTNPTQVVDAARQAQAQPLANTGDNDAINTARLTRGLANAVQQRGGAVTLRLTPPEMGTVRIQMQITGTNISASFHAESTSAQTLLTTQLAQLRSSLESKGMSVERLSVQPLASTASSNNTNQSQNQGDTQQQGQTQQQNAGDGRSRGQYSGDSSGSGTQQDNDPSSQHQARRGFFDRLNDAAESEAA